MRSSSGSWLWRGRSCGTTATGLRKSIVIYSVAPHGTGIWMPRMYKLITLIYTLHATNRVSI